MVDFSRGQVRRGFDPGEAGLVEPRVAAVAAHGHDGDVRADFSLRIEQSGKLAQRHGVLHGHFEVGDERFQPGFERRSAHARRADRIGPVEHDHLHASLGSFLHKVGHCGGVGVEAHADILDVDHHRIESREHRSAWPAARPVETVDGETGGGVAPGFNVALSVGTQTVLGAEQRDQLHARRLGQDVDSAASGGIAARLVGEQADAQAGKLGKPAGGEHVDAEQNLDALCLISIGHGCCRGLLSLRQIWQ